MEFRTRINIKPSRDKISYRDPVMFIGSCFASEMGSQMRMGRMHVMINPAGTVFNPVSVCNTIDLIMSGREISLDDLYNYEGTWLSFNHYTDFSDRDPSKVLDNINRRSGEALDFLKQAQFLFITFGTARVYRWKKNGVVVSNCHKIPSANFNNELLSVDSIVSLWSEQLDKINSLFPQLKIIFTISPVRHWKDGSYGNQVSKSVLFLSVDKLLSHRINPQYFPAYELLMDELRDYRFYADDMLHPSDAAINYIWEVFSGCYLEKSTIDTWNEVVKISKAHNHRISTDSNADIKKFAERILYQITLVESKNAAIDLSPEREYFNGLLSRATDSPI
jgi:hypothetical protein